jgi:hypothetical protein
MMKMKNLWYKIKTKNKDEEDEIESENEVWNEYFRFMKVVKDVN